MDAVEEIKSRLAVEDVVSEYVQLKRAGRNLKGLSPFTNEKTPSFTVSPEKQIWHDFSSGRGGDMFSFIEYVEGVDFKGALELLARKAGVDLAQYRTSAAGQNSTKQKERLYEINELSTKFYQAQFAGNKQALEYVLKKRQFSKQTALMWRLGYAPNNGRALVDFLKTRGYSDHEIKLAGLTSRFGSDMFRGRLMIPLADGQGRVVGFTARQLAASDAADNSPKYINTPSTPLYDKSRHVFGLHLSKTAIREHDYAVVAEGNLDVIQSHQAGVRQVVATAGTALTEHHLKALSRLTGDIRLCFDADAAGLNATERAIPIASRTKVSLSIITIPSGKDPDELIKQDPAAWQRIIESPQYALDWLMERYEALVDITTAQGKRKFSDVLLPVVNALSDPVEQDHYLVAMAERLDTNREALIEKLQQNRPQPLKKRPKSVLPSSETKSRAELEHTKQQDQFMALMLFHPNLRESLELVSPAMVAAPEAKKLIEFLMQQRDFRGSDPKSSKQLRAISEYCKMLGLIYEELYQGLEDTELRYEATRLQARLVESYVKNQKKNLSAQLRDADAESAESLLVHVKQLDTLLKRVSRLEVRSGQSQTDE